MCFELNPTPRVCRCCGADANPVRGVSKPADICLSCFTTVARRGRQNAALDRMASDASRVQVSPEDCIDPRNAPLAIVGPGGEYMHEIKPSPDLNSPGFVQRVKDVVRGLTG